MTKPLTILFLSLICLTQLPAFAQTFAYSYDANGNRVQRELETSGLREAKADPLAEGEESPLLEGGLEKMFSIYPNPSNGAYTVSVPIGELEGPATITVYDLSGRLLHINEQPTELNQIDLSKQPTGIYLIKVRSGGESYIRRVVKE